MAGQGHPQATPVGVLIGRIALELHHLQAQGRRLEDAIGRAILGEEPSTQDVIANLQGIDMIVQTLGELGNFLDNIQPGIPDGHDVETADALARVTLRDLANALSGGLRQPTVDAQGRISGEVDLF